MADGDGKYVAFEKQHARDRMAELAHQDSEPAPNLDLMSAQLAGSGSEGMLVVYLAVGAVLLLLACVYLEIT